MLPCSYSFFYFLEASNGRRREKREQKETSKICCPKIFCAWLKHISVHNIGTAGGFFPRIERMTPVVQFLNLEICFVYWFVKFDPTNIFSSRHERYFSSMWPRNFEDLIIPKMFVAWKIDQKYDHYPTPIGKKVTSAWCDHPICMIWSLVKCF